MHCADDPVRQAMPALREMPKAEAANEEVALIL
jgi:hypothetical protein